jgi:hypothetical protein
MCEQQTNETFDISEQRLNDKKMQNESTKNKNVFVNIVGEQSNVCVQIGF